MLVLDRIEEKIYLIQCSVWVHIYFILELASVSNLKKKDFTIGKKKDFTIGSWIRDFTIGSCIRDKVSP